MNYLKNHFAKMSSLLAEFDGYDFTCLTDPLEECLRQKRFLFTGGNGGSFSIVQHFCTDISKGLFEKKKAAFRTVNLSDNSSLLTAISNDLNYSQSLTLPFEMMANEGDFLFLVSSSGKSQNLLNLVKAAKDRNCKVLSLTGFGSSPLADMSDFNISIHSNSYQEVEDAHAVICHALYLHFLNDAKYELLAKDY